MGGAGGVWGLLQCRAAGQGSDGPRSRASRRHWPVGQVRSQDRSTHGASNDCSGRRRGCRTPHPCIVVSACNRVSVVQDSSFRNATMSSCAARASKARRTGIVGTDPATRRPGVPRRRPSRRRAINGKAQACESARSPATAEAGRGRGRRGANGTRTRRHRTPGLRPRVRPCKAALLKSSGCPRLLRSRGAPSGSACDRRACGGQLMHRGYSGPRALGTHDELHGGDVARVARAEQADGVAGHQAVEGLVRRSSPSPRGGRESSRCGRSRRHRCRHQRQCPDGALKAAGTKRSNDIAA